MNCPFLSLLGRLSCPSANYRDSDVPDVVRVFVVRNDSAYAARQISASAAVFRVTEVTRRRGTSWRQPARRWSS